MPGLPPLSEILEEYQLVDGEDRYRLLIDLGRQLEPMPDALKTEATQVRGCSASVWVYPTVENGRLHFLADSNADIVSGLIALLQRVFSGQSAKQILAFDVEGFFRKLGLDQHISPGRRNGLASMVQRVRALASQL